MPPSAAASKSTRLRSEPGGDGGLTVCVAGEGAAGDPAETPGIQKRGMGHSRIPHEGCGCSGWMGTLESPAPIRKGSGGFLSGTLDLRSKKIWFVGDAFWAMGIGMNRSHWSWEGEARTLSQVVGWGHS